MSVKQIFDYFTNLVLKDEYQSDDNYFIGLNGFNYSDCFYLKNFIDKLDLRFSNERVNLENYYNDYHNKCRGFSFSLCDFLNNNYVNYTFTDYFIFNFIRCFMSQLNTVLSEIYEIDKNENNYYGFRHFVSREIFFVDYDEVVEIDDFKIGLLCKLKDEVQTDYNVLCMNYALGLHYGFTPDFGRGLELKLKGLGMDFQSFLKHLGLSDGSNESRLTFAVTGLKDGNGNPYVLSSFDTAVDGWYLKSLTGSIEQKKVERSWNDIRSYLRLSDDASLHFRDGMALISKGGFIDPEKEIYKSYDYDSVMLSNERLVYGLTYGNKPFSISFSDMTHMLIVGQSGSGKSVLQNWFAVQFLHNIDRLARLYLVDLKGGVEFFPYDGLHEKIITCSDFEQLEQAVNDACVEMDERLQSMKERGLRKWDGERIVFMVDEYAQIKLSGVAFLGKDKAKLLDANLLRLSMLGRAAGIRLICGLQKCTTAEMDSAFKNNLQTQICFKVKDGLTVSNVFGDTEAVKEQGVNMLKLPKGRAFCSIDGHDDALVQFPFISDKALNEFLTAFKE